MSMTSLNKYTWIKEDKLLIIIIAFTPNHLKLSFPVTLFIIFICAILAILFAIFTVNLCLAPVLVFGSDAAVN